MVNEFDRSRYKLGKLCRRKHEYKDTGMSVRRIKGGHCLCCKKETGQEWRNNNLETARRSSRESGRRSTKKAEYNAQWKRDNSEKVKEWGKEYYLKNKDEYKRRDREYREKNKKEIHLRKSHYRSLDGARTAIRQAARLRSKTEENRAKAKIKSHKRRCVKKSVLNIPYTHEDLQLLLQKFNFCCAYCATEAKLTIDHYIPLRHKGGDHLGNLIPACSTCNARKQSQMPDYWYPKQQFYCPTRHAQIKSHLEKEIRKCGIASENTMPVQLSLFNLSFS